jgi:hypothetical protein
MNYSEGGGKIYINFWLENLKRRIHLVRKIVDEIIILKRISWIHLHTEWTVSFSRRPPRPREVVILLVLYQKLKAALHCLHSEIKRKRLSSMLNVSDVEDSVICVCFRRSLFKQIRRYMRKRQVSSFYHVIS